MLIYRMQIGFLLYVGLVMLSYGFNKFSRTPLLLSQLSLLFQSTTVSWNGYVKQKLGKFIQDYKKTVAVGKARFLSSAKLNVMQSPHEVNQRKAVDFFALWCRHVVMRKLGVILQVYQDNYRANPDQALFCMKILTDKDKAEINKPNYVSFYEKKSFSLFQYE